MTDLVADVDAETPLEAEIMADPDWVAGLSYGSPRPGHPEGAVAYHIPEVLANVDRLALNLDDRARLRLVALAHDNFKYQVDRTKVHTGENHHGMLARRFLERYVEDEALLTVVELHDEAFSSWKKATLYGKPDKGLERAERLLARLGDGVGFFLRFFRCDNETGDKTPDSVEWFTAVAEDFAISGWCGLL